MLGIITKGKFLQVEVVGCGSGNRKRKVIEEMILVRCRNSISEGGKVRVFTVQRQEQPWGVWKWSAGEKVRRHARPCPNQHFTGTDYPTRGNNSLVATQPPSS